MIFSPDFCLFLVPVQNVVRPCQPPRPHTLLSQLFIPTGKKIEKKKGAVTYASHTSHPYLLMPLLLHPSLDPQLSSIHPPLLFRPLEQPSPSSSILLPFGPLHGVRRPAGGGSVAVVCGHHERGEGSSGGRVVADGR